MNYIDAINLAEKAYRDNAKRRVIVCLNEKADSLVRIELANRGYRWISGANLKTKTYFDRYNFATYIMNIANKTVYREDEKDYAQGYRANPLYFEKNERFIVVNNLLALHDEDAFLKLLG